VLVIADATHESPPNPAGLSSATPPSSAAPNSRDPCARCLLARRRRHLGPALLAPQGYTCIAPSYLDEAFASASELADAALYAVHAEGERRLPESCRRGRSRGGAGEWRAAPALVMGAATTPQGQEEREVRGRRPLRCLPA
jgi:hypothetical protein